MSKAQLPMAVTSLEVRNSILNCSDDVIGQVIDSIECSCGKLTDAQYSALHVHLQNWLERVVESFEFPISSK